MTSLNLFISNFHFIRPYWLLAILALFLILWLLKKHRFHHSPWQKFLPNHLSHVLVEGASNISSPKSSKGKQSLLLKPFIIGILSIVALAGPAWKKLPQPVYQTERGSVLIMDMSYSMYATDIKPNRLTRARFKAIDLLDKINEGDTGLIAYAGDAFTISPLTQDIKNIALLLPSLSPDIMPVPGANPIAALSLAHDMLINAGHLNGDIYWFTDDVDNEEIADIYDWSNKYGHQLNILGVGSESGAPITLPSGELLKDSSGAIVVPRLPSQKLQSLASRGQGNYRTISNDDSDINNLIIKDKLSEKSKDEKQQSQQTGDQWQEQGAWLLIIVLPLMLSYFRRGGSLLMLTLSCFPLLFSLSVALISPTSFAAQSTAKTTAEANNSNLEQSQTGSSTLANASQKLWQNLWQTNNQQAQQQYNQKNYQGAAQQFENSQWQGSAHYKAGNYQAALDAFKDGEQANSANSLYNQGNALAQMQQYEQAIKSYEKALEKNPNLQDAKDNIAKIKQQQKDQEQQQKQQNNEQSQSDDSQNEQSKNQENQQSQNQQNKDNQQPDDSQNSDSQNEQSENQENQSESKPENKSQEQQAKEDEQKQQEQQQKSAEQTEEQSKEGEEKTPAQIAAEQQAKETEQKHQQLLNKVTDDPYLLLRNKMQLEYQKRKQDGTTRGVKKQW